MLTPERPASEALEMACEINAAPVSGNDISGTQKVSAAAGASVTLTGIRHRTVESSGETAKMRSPVFLNVACTLRQRLSPGLSVTPVKAR